MCVSEKQKLMIPVKMGYGAQGFPQKIPGMANNVFSCLLVPCEKFICVDSFIFSMAITSYRMRILQSDPWTIELCRQWQVLLLCGNKEGDIHVPLPAHPVQRRHDGIFLEIFNNQNALEDNWEK
jgi:hypothetical protein